MRIIGEIDHPVLKITAFKMNEKVSIKLENELIEHIIKFRDGSGIETLEDVKTFLDDQLLEDVMKSIYTTASNRSRKLKEMNESSLEDSFPKIM